MAYEKFKERIVNLQSDWGKFKVEFLDRDDFSRFSYELFYKAKDFKEILITGYFSETVRQDLEKILRIGQKVRLITPSFSLRGNRNQKNLQVLKKLVEAGADIRVNERMHARIFVAYSPGIGGMLIIGSFDFNSECMGKERHDVGIKTTHPDLLHYAITLFTDIWNQSETMTLEAFENKRNTN